MALSCCLSCGAFAHAETYDGETVRGPGALASEFISRDGSHYEVELKRMPGRSLSLTVACDGKVIAAGTINEGDGHNFTIHGAPVGLDIELLDGAKCSSLAAVRIFTVNDLTGDQPKVVSWRVDFRDGALTGLFGPPPD